jgi:hypothetical protein
MTAMSAGAPPLDIGRVIQDLFAVLARNFVPFVILAAILTGIPSMLLGLAHLDAAEYGLFSHWTSRLFPGLIKLVASLILQGALIYGAVGDLTGRRASVAECLSVGLNNFLPLFAIGLLLGLAILCGLILFVIPGVVLAVIWSVAVPAFVAERLEPMQGFGRSAQLTQGNRLRIFALMVIFVLAAMVLGALAHAAGVGASIIPWAGDLVRDVVIQPIVAVIEALVGSTGAAVLYVELRRLREGVGAEGLAAGFVKS